MTVGGPGFGYNGNITDIKVYFDTVYKTFAFVPITSAPAVTGILKTATGEVARPWTEVTLIENGVKHRTFTDAKGEFGFFGNISRPATIQVNGVTIREIPPLPPPPKLELQMK